MVENGLYRIKDAYYTDFPNDKHIQIKQGRPFYYAVKDNRGVFWFIPLSTQVSNYRQKIAEVEAKRGKGNCMIYHIGKVADQEMAFRICDMIPIIPAYIDGEFYKYGKHYVVEDKNLIREISRKSRNFIKQLEIGRMYSQIGALEIRKKLTTCKL